MHSLGKRLEAKRDEVYRISSVSSSARTAGIFYGNFKAKDLTVLAATFLMRVETLHTRISLGILVFLRFIRNSDETSWNCFHLYTFSRWLIWLFE